MAAQHTATFTFHGSLNDFLRKSARGRALAYAFNGNPAAKDAIEAMGVPHPEVALILQNGTPSTFATPLRPGAQLEVYPYELLPALPGSVPLVPLAPEAVQFVLDVHLGTLAKALRMLGFDTRYSTNMADAALAAVASAEQRILLTRDIGLLKQRQVTNGYWLRSQHTTEQLQEVIRRYNLYGAFNPLTRCLCCNSKIEEVSKELVLPKLPPKTRQYYNEFYMCTSCDKVYWKGSHYEHMVATIQTLQAP